jgi:hypothetical protein
MTGAVPLRPTHALIVWAGTSTLFMNVRTSNEKKTPARFISVCLSVLMSACIRASPAGRILAKFGICDFYENLIGGIHIYLKPDKIIGQFMYLLIVAGRHKFAIPSLSFDTQTYFCC